MDGCAVCPLVSTRREAGHVAEVMGPDKIPADFGKAMLLPKDEITIPPRETGNKRCA